jgi:FHA domain
MLSIHRRAALALCCALACALCGAPARATAEEVRSLSLRGLHVAADGAVTLYISFRSGRDSAVGSVDNTKLRVERGGSVLPGALKVRAPGAGDLALLLAVDVSGTMRKVMPEIQRGLKPLGGLMKRTGARVAVGAIGASWRVTRDFTAEAGEVRKAVKALQASAATTALFESIHLGIGQLRQRGADLPPRRLMIVVSDAYNEKKGRTPDECVAAARKALVQVHSLIYLTRRTAETLSRKGELEKISRDSGGTTVTVSGAKELRRGLRALVDDLLLERVITIPAERLVHDGREHTLTLRYDRVSASVKYQAPLITGAGATVAPPTTSAPDAAPAAAAVGEPVVSKKAVSKKAVSKKAVSKSKVTGKKVAGKKVTAKKVGPSVEPAASAEEHGALETSTLLQRLQDPRVLGAGGGGLLLIIIAVILVVVLRRRAKRLVTDLPADEPANEAAVPASSRPTVPQPAVSSEPAQVIVAPPAGPAPAPETHARPTLRVDAPGAERARAASAAPSGPELGGLAPAVGPITQLRDVHGLVASTPFKLTSAGARIGSGLSNEIVLDSPTVSDRHAEIVATPTGFAVRDCGSTQGTFLGEVRVGAEPLPIRPGSRIKVGLVTLVCEG